ncbi:MAG: hypothetical protein ACOCTL_01135 [Candidatus Hadarchaeota archaeon]
MIVDIELGENLTSLLIFAALISIFTVLLVDLISFREKRINKVKERERILVTSDYIRNWSTGDNWDKINPSLIDHEQIEEEILTLKSFIEIRNEFHFRIRSWNGTRSVGSDASEKNPELSINIPIALKENKEAMPGRLDLKQVG